MAPAQSTSDIRPVVIDNLSTAKVTNILVTSTPAKTTILLAGNDAGSLSVTGYARGTVYNQTALFTGGQNFNGLFKPSSMLTGAAKHWYTKPKPVYPTLLAANVVNVKYHGVVGDGVTDDLAAIQAVINQYVGTGKMGELYSRKSGVLMIVNILALQCIFPTESTASARPFMPLLERFFRVKLGPVSAPIAVTRPSGRTKPIRNLSFKSENPEMKALS